MFLPYNVFTCMTCKSKNDGCGRKLLHKSLRDSKKIRDNY